jgi:hypothetical protein
LTTVAGLYLSKHHQRHFSGVERVVTSFGAAAHAAVNGIVAAQKSLAS